MHHTNKESESLILKIMPQQVLDMDALKELREKNGEPGRMGATATGAPGAIRRLSGSQ